MAQIMNIFHWKLFFKLYISLKWNNRKSAWKNQNAKKWPPLLPQKKDSKIWIMQKIKNQKFPKLLGYSNFHFFSLKSSSSFHLTFCSWTYDSKYHFILFDLSSFFKNTSKFYDSWFFAFRCPFLNPNSI